MAKFKTLNIGDTVRVVSLADTYTRCGIGSFMERFVGDTFEVTELDRHQSTGLGQVKLSNGWWFSPKGLEVVTPVEALEYKGDAHGEFVTPDTPVGTTVFYIGGDEYSRAPVLVPLQLTRHDGDYRPRVDVIGSTDPSDYYYPHYKYLRVLVGGVTQEEPTEPTPEPTEADFKYTRVRVKDTGAEGVVVGRSSIFGSIAVLHDEANADLHGGNHLEVDFVGVPDRIWYYKEVEALEIIGGVQ